MRGVGGSPIPEAKVLAIDLLGARNTFPYESTPLTLKAIRIANPILTQPGKRLVVGEVAVVPVLGAASLRLEVAGG